MTQSPEGRPAFGAGQPVEFGDPEQVDASLDQADGVDAEATPAEQDDQPQTPEERRIAEWEYTAETAQPWGERLGRAYAEARAAAGGTVTRQYDEQGELPRSTEEDEALALQPDVLVVNLVNGSRNWRDLGSWSGWRRFLRHPFAGEVREEVALAGWTIQTNEIAAPKSAAAAAEAAASKARDARKPQRSTSRLDAIAARHSRAAEEDEDEPVEEADEAPKEQKHPGVWTEKIVLMSDGSLMRFAGRSAEPHQVGAPLRFAYKRPDESLLPDENSAEDDDDGKATAAYDKQVALIDEYAKLNKDRFVDPSKFDFTGVLDAPDIQEGGTDLGGKDVAKVPRGVRRERLEPWMVCGAMHDFLAERGLATDEELDAFRV